MPTFKSKRGRPQKFNRPARQVTLTLPDDVIARLSRVDDDMGRAVVRLAMAGRPAAESCTVWALPDVTLALTVKVVVPPAVTVRIAGMMFSV